MKTALIDADIYAYLVAAGNEKRIDWGDGQISITQESSLDECCSRLDKNIEFVSDRLKVDETIICLTHEIEFRKVILPSYKAHRDPTKKPEYLKALKQHLIDTWPSFKKPGLEADDCMGILSTHPKLIAGKKVIVSIDKDMESIPGWLFNPDKDTKPRQVTEQQADFRFFMQVLTGDATDGYKGVPGIGAVKAEYILGPSARIPSAMWAAVVGAYKAKDLTEEDALLQARVARICRHTDYDYKKGEVKLWNPPCI